MFGDSNLEVEKKSTPTLSDNKKPSGVLSIFNISMKKGSDKEASIIQ